VQVVYALGPVAGRLPEGGFGYIDNMTPERVEAQGQQLAFINALLAFLDNVLVLLPGNVQAVGTWWRAESSMLLLAAVHGHAQSRHSRLLPLLLHSQQSLNSTPTATRPAGTAGALC
jgi:hypothetical protein